ncbi:MAG: methyl-accepting chemotaxis protein [Roseobacter sp.]
MTTENKAMTKPKGSFIYSIFFKCLLLVAFSCIITSAVLTYKSIRATDKLATDSVLIFGDQMIAQLSQRAIPAVRFQNVDGLSEMMSQTVEAMGESTAGGVVLGADGAVLAEAMREGKSSELMIDLARQTVEDGEARTDIERLIIVRPIISGAEAEVIGVVALDWQTEAIYAVVAEQKKFALTVASGLATIMLLLAGFMINRIVAKPMAALAASTKKISDGDYESDVAQFKPGNEVYPVSEALSEFQEILKGSEAARKDAKMKSAALDAGSAAIMIANADFKIVYASKAVLDLLNHHSNVIRSRVEGFNPEAILGQSIDIFHKKPDMQRNMLGALGPKGHDASLEMDDVTLELKISKIDGEEGERIGYVVEWADVSEQHLNAAVLDSLNNNQARAEFGQDGQLLDANDEFRKLAGLTSESQGCIFSQTVLVDQQPADPSKAMFGELTISGENGTVSHLLGGLSPVMFKNGDLKRTVLIAADVTDDHNAKLAAEDERERMQNEQDGMISSLSNALATLADGNLTVRINETFKGSNDRIRQDFNIAIDRLDEAIASVVSGTTEINAEVAGVANAATELSKRTESQAATLEETAAAISEISESVTNSAEGARSANEVVVAAQNDAHASGKVVHEAVNAMGEIEKSSSEISSIVKVIDDIAFQTNLLALNAGVEAARAGDAGRGFAVVASEVRALAQRSSEAASEIGTLISTSSDSVELGVKLVGDAGEALENIISSIANISEYVSQIASASQEQSSSVVEINSAMGQLDQVTQENAAMFEETTAASQNLSRVASDLTGRVQHFSTQSKAEQKVENLNTLKPGLDSEMPNSEAQLPTAKAANDTGWSEF